MSDKENPSLECFKADLRDLLEKYDASLEVDIIVDSSENVQSSNFNVYLPGTRAYHQCYVLVKGTSEIACRDLR